MICHNSFEGPLKYLKTADIDNIMPFAKATESKEFMHNNYETFHISARFACVCAAYTLALQKFVHVCVHVCGVHL